MFYKGSVRIWLILLINAINKYPKAYLLKNIYFIKDYDDKFPRVGFLSFK